MLNSFARFGSRRAMKISSVCVLACAAVWLTIVPGCRIDGPDDGDRLDNNTVLHVDGAEVRDIQSDADEREITAGWLI